MAIISTPTYAWSGPVATTTDQLWQARRGEFMLATGATEPAAGDGIRVPEGQAVLVGPNLNVWYARSPEIEDDDTLVIAHVVV